MASRVATKTINPTPLKTWQGQETACTSCLVATIPSPESNSCAFKLLSVQADQARPSIWEVLDHQCRFYGSGNPYITSSSHLTKTIPYENSGCQHYKALKTKENSAISINYLVRKTGSICNVKDLVLLRVG